MTVGDGRVTSTVTTSANGWMGVFVGSGTAVQAAVMTKPKKSAKARRALKIFIFLDPILYFLYLLYNNR